MQSCSHQDIFDKFYSYNTSRDKLVREAVANYLFEKSSFWKNYRELFADFILLQHFFCCMKLHINFIITELSRYFCQIFSLKKSFLLTNLSKRKCLNFNIYSKFTFHSMKVPVTEIVFIKHQEKILFLWKTFDVETFFFFLNKTIVRSAFNCVFIFSRYLF